MSRDERGMRRGITNNFMQPPVEVTSAEGKHEIRFDTRKRAMFIRARCKGRSLALAASSDTANIYLIDSGVERTPRPLANNMLAVPRKDETGAHVSAEIAN